jgi:hypothetical protein
MDLHPIFSRITSCLRVNNWSQLAGACPCLII